MLAPTRELVAELNRRARDHRLGNGAPAGQEVRLGDGNRASVGDMIITRANDRRLRLSATDWVKNGDRWTITHVDRSGGLTVRHSRSQLKCRLPADYVTTSTGLGYATTIHGAQGVSADTMHGLLTGQESRQQLYTMLTRGRHANHLYLQVVGDGDPHSLIRPDTISPRTPTETLQQILARDEAPVSASTVLRELNDPAARLFQAVQRYTDGLHVAAEQLLGPQTVAELDQADQYIPGLTTEPAWPTLRAHLLALAAETGEHPLRHLLTAATGRDLHTAGDMAAVLYWRLPELTPTNPGPLPWLPGIPETLQAHPVWGDYLAKRSQLVADLADQVQDHACQGDGQPVWAATGKLTRAPPSSAKSQCGGPPTASIPKTRDQPEEPNSKRSRPCGNNASTGISRVPPTRQQMRGPTSDRQHTPHLDAGTTTASARTKHPVTVRTGQPHPAVKPPLGLLRRALWFARYRAPPCQLTAESGSTRVKRLARSPRRCACPRLAAAAPPFRIAVPCHCAGKPPSTGRATLTTKLAPGLHSQRTDAAISTPRPRRPIGVVAVAAARSSSPLAIMSGTIGVSMVPGPTALMRIPRGAYSTAVLVVGPITPRFDAV